METAFLVFGGFVLLFGFVVFFGAPYLPTLKGQTEYALEMLDLKPGQTLLELGSGDGTVIKAAAERGLKVVAIELNPALVLVSYIRTFKYRKQVRIIWGNFWLKAWPEADGIFVFLLDKYMEKLDKKIIQTYEGKNIKLASHAFKVPGRKIAKEKGGIYLYSYLPVAKH